MDIQEMCKAVAKWRESKGFETDWLNVPEKLMLTVTELAEAMEAYRHIPLRYLQKLDAGTITEKDVHALPTEVQVREWFPWYENFQEELADTFIRLFDLCGSLNIDIVSVIRKKMKVNAARQQKHGKEC